MHKTENLPSDYPTLLDAHTDVAWDTLRRDGIRTPRIFQTAQESPSRDTHTGFMPHQRYYSLAEIPRIDNPVLVYYEAGAYYPIRSVGTAFSSDNHYDTWIARVHMGEEDKDVRLTAQEAFELRRLFFN